MPQLSIYSIMKTKELLKQQRLGLVEEQWEEFIYYFF